jgi:2-iminobutanoate/2-iminopropanoate deaminase
MTTRKTNRRALLTGAAAVAVAGAALSKTAKAADAPQQKKVYRTGPKPATPPAYSTGVSLGNLLFLSGVICRTPGDIKAHTEFAMGEIKKQLEAAGSSMEKVLRCTVFLADMKDFAGMNEVYTGKFGEDPPTRSTIAAAWIPANSLVEIDVIAYI